MTSQQVKKWWKNKWTIINIKKLKNKKNESVKNCSVNKKK